MADNVDVDTDAFVRGLHRKRGRLERFARREIDEFADDMARDAATSAPVDTGALRDSIEVVRTRDGAEVGSRLGYAAYVEFGSSDRPPRPYMRPAQARAVSRFRRRVR